MLTAPPHLTDRVNDVARPEVSTGRRLRLSGLAAAEQPALVEYRGTAGTGEDDRSVHCRRRQERTVRSIQRSPASPRRTSSCRPRRWCPIPAHAGRVVRAPERIRTPLLIAISWRAWEHAWEHRLRVSGHGWSRFRPPRSCFREPRAALPQHDRDRGSAHPGRTTRAPCRPTRSTRGRSRERCYAIPEAVRSTSRERLSERCGTISAAKLTEITQRVRLLNRTT